MEWEAVIGLEIHVQLTCCQSKLFSGAATTFGAAANTQACAVDLALPGVLPVLNRKAVESAIKLGLAIDAQIDQRSVFARKNYFYPDLPKGYQISQFERPVVHSGHIDITLSSGDHKRIGVTRAHLEEDAGKSMHEEFDRQTGIDLNRAGTPLLEIVSEPEISSAAEAVAYLKKIHALVRYLDISDANMQEGSFRCDANVSVRPKGQVELGTRAECKNINSFRFVERAINHEIVRQIELIEDDGSVIQETRLYDPDRDETRSMRSKEEAFDYRYFPDPDLLPVVIADDWIASVATTLPELPEAKIKRLINELSLKPEDAEQLASSRELADYFEDALSTFGDQPQTTANWITGELLGRLNKESLPLSQCPISPTQLAGLISRVADGTISGKIGKEVFTAIWDGEGDADQIIDGRNLKQITDTGELEALVAQVIADNPSQVAEFRSGKEKILGYFVGQIMKQTHGKANPGEVNRLLRDRLKN
ncbi:MAG: Asp-tRNA(Asn)/Glu-tRNA(Gln) amidotransferase GatCAB subunit B [Gammaproteobacteria bacterium]|nr:MAG: Asp-tRNA(Asn)/Glu-tRNA(Gln) amidotransferase GatCAB subunit B [Gammaproteobacteria bacterium]